MARATDVIRGSKRSHEDLCKRAKGKQLSAKLSSDEAEIITEFHKVGLYPTPLLAVDKYNIDFAFEDELVAVEYNGGNWHNTPKKIAEDERKLALLRSQGWRVMSFPRIKRSRAVDSGNASILITDLVEEVVTAIQSNHPLREVQGSPRK